MVLLGWTVVIPWWLLTSDCLLSFPKERMLLKQAVKPLPHPPSPFPSLTSICASRRWDISSRADIKCCGYFRLFFFFFFFLFSGIIFTTMRPTFIFTAPATVLVPNMINHGWRWCTLISPSAAWSSAHWGRTQRWTLKRNSFGCNKAKNFPSP